MASENETVEDIAHLLRVRNNGDDFDDWNLADRLESAWRRERELICTSDWTKCAMCQTNKTGEVYGDIPPPVGYDDECDECEIAKRLRSGKPMPKRNCDLFNNGDDAFYAFDNKCKLKHIKSCRAGKKMCTGHDSIHCFKDWLFAPVAEGGEK